MRRAQVGLAMMWAMGMAGVLASLPVEAVVGQEMALANRRPRFLYRPAVGATPVEIDASRHAVLRRVVSLRVEQPTIGRLLAAIERQTGMMFAYDDVFPASRAITFRADSVTVAAALSGILLDTGVDVILSRRGEVALVKVDRATVVQQGTVAGRVTDAASGVPLAGADVRVLGTQLAAMTDDSGRYVLREVPAGQQRVAARRIGYEAQTSALRVTYRGTTTLDFALKVVATRLDDLVTTVTGDQRRLEVGNSIASLDADSLMRSAPIMSFGDLLQGRAPGVLSLPEGGMVGKAGRVRVRGLNSFQVSNDPIVVVDGARVEGSAGGAAGVDVGGLTGRLADINPDEIASVEVVRGPAAATLYGTDAANGVIVITTKRGQPGKSRWTAYTEQGLVEQRLDYADQFPAAYHAFGRDIGTNAAQRCTLLQRAEGSCIVDSLASFNTFADPATRPFKGAHRHQYGLQASGGAAGGATYFLSGDYEEETGPAHMPEVDQAFVRAQRGVREVPDWQVRPNAFERLNLRANLTTPLGTRGSATLATGYVSNQARAPAGIFPFAQVGYRDVNDGWAGGGTTRNRRPGYGFAMRGEDNVRRFTGSLAMTYSARDWLTLRGTVGADLSTNASGTLLRRGDGIPGSPQALGLRQTVDVGASQYSLDLGATATQAFSPAVSSKTSVGVQYNRHVLRSGRVGASDLPLGGETIAGGTLDPFSTGEATLTTAVAGGYVEEMLGFRDRLFLTGALRLDGGSAFGQDFSVAAYPKGGVSWVVTDGETGPRLPAVNSLRLRAGYGASGVQPGPTDALALVLVESGLAVSGAAAGPAGRLVNGNPDLKPERTSEIEAGMDVELWASRVRLEFTAYQRTSTDALVSRPNGPDVGGSRIENLGSVRNRGLELLLTADLLRGRGLAAGFTASGALNDNKLRRLAHGVSVSSPSSELERQDVGYPLFGLWGYLIDSFTDANGNGIIEPSELVITGPNTQYVGPGFPTREATFTPYVRLFDGTLHMSGLFQYRGGFLRYNGGDRHATCVLASSCRAVNDPRTPLAEQARAVAWSTFFLSGPDIQDVSSLLLRELSLEVTLPSGVARLLGAARGRVVLAGRNLAVLWKASDARLENAIVSADQSFAATGPGPSTYWLLRVNLNY